VDGDSWQEVIIGSDDGKVYCFGIDWTGVSSYKWPSLCWRVCVNRTGCYIDRDEDGLPDDYEATAGTDPGQADSEGDGLPDGWEFTFCLIRCRMIPVKILTATASPTWGSISMAPIPGFRTRMATASMTERR